MTNGTCFTFANGSSTVRGSPVHSCCSKIQYAYSAILAEQKWQLLQTGTMYEDEMSSSSSAFKWSMPNIAINRVVV